MDASCDSARLRGVFMQAKSIPDCRVAAIYQPAMTPSMRHEINNVLAALMAEVQLMQMDHLTPEQADALDRILLQTHRLRDLLRTVTLTAPEPPAE